LHIDIITAGAGMGMYFGILSERGPFFDGIADWSVPAAFAFLGLRIPFIRLSLMSWTSWFALGSVVCVLVLARVISFASVARAARVPSAFRPFLLTVAISGPAAALLMRRFIPGHPLEVGGGPGKTETYVILLEALVICITAATIVERFITPLGDAPSTREEQ
jgi:hypothetical protein